MIRAVAQDRLRPPVDRVFGLDEVEAFAHFAVQRHLGKVCIRF